MTEEYLKEFERWVAGPKARKAQLRAELEEHLRSAEAAGDIEALKRLGTPREAARTFSDGHETSLSPLPRRIGAILIDIGTIVAVLALGGLAGLAVSPDVGNGVPADELSSSDILFTSIAFMFVVVCALWWAIGMTVMEWRFGQTPGKAALGLRVIAEDGTAPSFGQVVVRRLTMVFSGPLQLIDWAFMFFTAKHQRAFEIIAKTVVIQDEPAKAAQYEVAHAQ